MSEKSFALSQATNTFAIDVPAGLDSVEVKQAVEKQFEVKVAKVRMVNRKGKVKRVINVTGKRSSNRTGVKADVRKAYVTLAEGSHLPFFAAEEKEIEDAKKEAEKKAKKADDKPAKKSKKESK
jgi:large subunit ribosomal protein L23